MKKKIFTLLTALVLSMGIGWAQSLSWSWTWSEFSSRVALSTGSYTVAHYNWYKTPGVTKTCTRIIFAYNPSNAGMYNGTEMPAPKTYSMSTSKGEGKVASYSWEYSGSAYYSMVYNSSGTKMIYDNESGRIIVEEGADGPYIHTSNLQLTDKNFYNYINSGAEMFITIGSPATYYNVMIQPNDGTMGTASYTYKSGYVYANNRSQEFKENSVYTLTATPNPGYRFVSWSDGGAQTHDVTITGNTTYTATFEPEQGGTITIESAGNGTVNSEASGDYNGGDQVTLTATPADGYMFVMWKKDGVATSLTQNATVTCSGDATYTAVFKRKYQVTATSADNTKGSASISPAPVNGYYYEGQNITLTATPANILSEFTQWNDGNTQNPRIVTVSGDATYTAEFSKIDAIEIIDDNGVMYNTDYGFIEGKTDSTPALGGRVRVRLYTDHFFLLLVLFR